MLERESIETKVFYTHLSTRDLQKIVNPLYRILTQNQDSKRLLGSND